MYLLHSWTCTEPATPSQKRKWKYTEQLLFNPGTHRTFLLNPCKESQIIIFYVCLFCCFLWCSNVYLLCVRECISEQQSTVDGKGVKGKTQAEEENERIDNHSQTEQREDGERLEKKVKNEKTALKTENEQRRGREKDRRKDEEETHKKDHNSWSQPRRYHINNKIVQHSHLVCSCVMVMVLFVLE